jgi:hypothetical protein
MKTILWMFAAWSIDVAVGYGFDRLITMQTGRPWPEPSVVSLGVGQAVAVIAAFYLGRRQKPPAR